MMTEPQANLKTPATADDGKPVVALVRSAGKSVAPLVYREGKNGGKLLVGGPHKRTGRPASWIRSEMRKGLANVVRIVNRAVRTGLRPAPEGKVGAPMTLEDYDRAGNFLGRFGVGVPVEVQASGDQPFTVVLGIMPGAPVERPAEPEDGRQSA